MRQSRLWRWVAASVVLGVAALGYVVWIPVRHVEVARVAALTATPSLRGFRPHPRGAEVDPTRSPLAAVKQASASTPAETAVRTVTWKGTTASSSALLEVLALPGDGDALAARSDARKAYTSRGSLTTKGFGYAGALAPPSVPGATGASYTAGTSPTTTARTRRTDALVYSVGRVVVVATAQGPGTQAKDAVDTLAVAEYHHLRRLEATGAARALGVTSFPPVATAVYGLVTLAVLAAAELSPWVATTVRRRRAAAWEEALRRERASRGSKVVRRQAGRTSTGTGRHGARRVGAGGAKGKG